MLTRFYTHPIVILKINLVSIRVILKEERCNNVINLSYIIRIYGVHARDQTSKISDATTKSFVKEENNFRFL